MHQGTASNHPFAEAGRYSSVVEPNRPRAAPDGGRGETTGFGDATARRKGEAGTTVVLVDKRHLARESLAFWLSKNSQTIEVHSFSDCEAVAKAGEGVSAADVVLISVGSQSPSDPDVVDALATVEDVLPGVPAILIADREDPAAVVEALAQGLRGYVPTSIGLAVLIGALALVQSGGTFVPASALSATPLRLTPPNAAAVEGFTPRQAQVLACLRQGKPNKTIAYELNMCESTVKVHVRHIMKKLQATNRTQVAFLTNRLFGEA